MSFFGEKNGVGRYVSARTCGLTVAGLTLAADAGTKAWIYQNQERLPIDVIPHVFSLVLAWNRGMSFSFFSTSGMWGPLLLGLLAVAAVVWFVHWMGTREAGSTPWLHQVGLGLLTGGALGNVVDRVVHGAVVDFLLVYGRAWYFPVFNLADSAISVGVALLLWDSIRQSRRVPSAPPEQN